MKKYTQCKIRELIDRFIYMNGIEIGPAIILTKSTFIQMPRKAKEYFDTYVPKLWKNTYYNKAC